MARDPDPYDGEEEREEEEEFEDEAPRSIFAATWFRALLVVIVLAVVAVLLLPYAQEWYAAAPKPPVTAVRPPAPPPPARPQPPEPAPAPADVPAAPAPAPAPPEVAKEPPPAPPAAPAPPVKPAEPAPRVAAKEPPAREPARRAPEPAAAAGEFWVQVGAFADARNASRLVARLSGDNYPTQQARVTRAGDGERRNEVFVAGATQRQVYDKVREKGYRADAVRGGAAVRPLLPLREAVALSKELQDAGMNVRIRRVEGRGGERRTVHLVRVGGFPDRPQAEAALKELADKGVPGFIVKGPPR
jgi:cell division septation protein DedD